MVMEQELRREELAMKKEEEERRRLHENQRDAKLELMQQQQMQQQQQFQQHMYQQQQQQMQQQMLQQGQQMTTMMMAFMETVAKKTLKCHCLIFDITYVLLNLIVDNLFETYDSKLGCCVVVFGIPSFYISLSNIYYPGLQMYWSIYSLGVKPDPYNVVFT